MKQPILNKKASFNYFFEDKISAGIVLSGAEVKSVRAGSMNLVDSYVKIIDGQAYLLNAYISPYKMALDPSYDPKRSRKLLLNKVEIEKLSASLASKNLTIVPTKVYTRANLIKVEIALAVPKKKADKRDQLKRKAIARETEGFLRSAKLKNK